MVSAAVCSKAVVLWVFSHCLWLPSLFCGRFVLYAVLSAILSFAIISLGKRELVALLYLRLSYDVTPGSEIHVTSCNKIDKPLFLQKFLFV